MLINSNLSKHYSRKQKQKKNRKCRLHGVLCSKLIKTYSLYKRRFNPLHQTQIKRFDKGN